MDSQDASLTQRVQAALQDLAPGGAVQVGAVQGIVELSGTVASDAEREALVQAARHVEGVKSVQDNLRMP